MVIVGLQHQTIFYYAVRLNRWRRGIIREAEVINCNKIEYSFIVHVQSKRKQHNSLAPMQKWRSYRLQRSLPLPQDGKNSDTKAGARQICLNTMENEIPTYFAFPCETQITMLPCSTVTACFLIVCAGPTSAVSVY